MTILGFLIVCDNIDLAMPAYLEDFFMLRVGEVKIFVGELASVVSIIRKHEGWKSVSLLHASLGDFTITLQTIRFKPSIIHA